MSRDFFNEFSVNNDVSDEQQILSFKGSFTSGLITTLLGFCEIRLDTLGLQLGMKKRVYSVLVELLQNLFHHHQQDSELDKEFGKHFGLFLWSENASSYIFTAGNIIKNDKREVISQHINYLNNMTLHEVREYYKYVLNNQVFSEKGGGGLGLIDMAKKTDKPLQYSFYNIKEDFDFFVLKLCIHTIKDGG